VTFTTAQSPTPRIKYRTSDLLATTLGHTMPGFSPTDWQPYPQRQGTRLSAPNGATATKPGFTDIVEAGEDLTAIITDWPAIDTGPATTWAESVPEQCGYLYIGLEGDGRLEVEALGSARRLGASCSITIAPRASTFLWRTGPNIERRGVCILFHARYLRRCYPDLLARRAGPLHLWLENEESNLRDFDIPLLPLMTASTKAMLTTRLEGQSRQIFVRSTAEQLLCLAITSLLSQSSCNPCLSTREQLVVQRVRARIDENLTELPGIEDIASTFGINRTKLRAGFKEAFGVSMSAYLFEQRMRVAFELLEDGQCSVGEVAARVGYPHVCNFTTSFKRRFGRVPSAVAQRRRP